MRTFGIAVLLAAAALCQGTPALTQPQCEDGAIVTITGTILDAREEKRAGRTSWIIEVDEQGAGECEVDEIQGDGRLPRGCTEGRRFRATGEYEDLLFDLLLHAQSISCN